MLLVSVFTISMHRDVTEMQFLPLFYKSDLSIYDIYAKIIYLRQFKAFNFVVQDN